MNFLTPIDESLKDNIVDDKVEKLPILNQEPITKRHSFDDAMLGDADDDKYNCGEEGTLSHRKLVQPDNIQEESKD